MKTRLTKTVFNMITTTLFLFLMYPFAVQAQADTVENYFPTKVGTTWFYRLAPEYTKERERVTITKDSISAIDNSHYLFLNDAVRPKYRVDTMGNVYFNPLSKKGENSNFLIFKQRANKLEAWAGSDSTFRIFRIKEIGISFILGQWRKVKGVEWGSKTDPDTFSFSPITQYYSERIGLYFAIVEPASTERILVGYISGTDTLGDITKVIDLKNSQLSSFILHQNYPNPFNSSTTIIYELKSEQFVTIKIFDLLGREVQELIHQQQSAGKHKVRFDADGLHTGMYILQLKSGDFVQVKKLLYLK